MKTEPKVVSSASADMHAEAAIPLFRPSSKNNLNDGPLDGDGEGGEDLLLSTALIEVASNGYMVTFTFEDGSEEKYVDADFDEVLKLIRSKH